MLQSLSIARKIPCITKNSDISFLFFYQTFELLATEPYIHPQLILASSCSCRLTTAGIHWPLPVWWYKTCKKRPRSNNLGRIWQGHLPHFWRESNGEEGHLIHNCLNISHILFSITSPINDTARALQHKLCGSGDGVECYVTVIMSENNRNNIGFEGIKILARTFSFNEYRHWRFGWTGSNFITWRWKKNKDSRA